MSTAHEWRRPSCARAAQVMSTAHEWRRQSFARAAQVRQALHERHARGAESDRERTSLVPMRGSRRCPLPHAAILLRWLAAPDIQALLGRGARPRLAAHGARRLDLRSTRCPPPEVRIANPSRRHPVHSPGIGSTLFSGNQTTHPKRAKHTPRRNVHLAPDECQDVADRTAHDAERHLVVFPARPLHTARGPRSRARSRPHCTYNPQTQYIR